MLNALGYATLDELSAQAMPENIGYTLPDFPAMSESDLERHMVALGEKNRPQMSLIGQGFFPNYCPALIRRNVLENPSWYTQYTPYQAEISQGRLEALFTFQTAITELTGLPVANASLLDEGNACSEAINMALQHHKQRRKHVFVCQSIPRHNREVIRSRFKYRDVTIVEGHLNNNPELTDDYAAVITAQFDIDGAYNSVEVRLRHAASRGIVTILRVDLLAATLYQSAGEMGADIAVGSAQRLGIPLGYGGPSAAFLACTDAFTRLLPGRIIGLSHDCHGQPAYRMALQTREQHIRRDRATSNICTAQSLLAIITAFYTVYHGPKGLRALAERVYAITQYMAMLLADRMAIVAVGFDTLTVRTPQSAVFTKRAREQAIEWVATDSEIRMAFNETLSDADIRRLAAVFDVDVPTVTLPTEPLPQTVARKTPYLVQPLFNTLSSETQLLRYIKRLETKDMSLADAMIPLGSCTMKLNATVQLLSLSNPQFANIHPFTDDENAHGYRFILQQLEADLATITALDATSLQPNSGAQGEFAGLMCIRDYLASIGESHRDIAIIPTSAHGTNPASAALCGLRIIPVACTDTGDISRSDLQSILDTYGDRIAVLMVTYPSTFGVFDDTIREVCEWIHAVGGQVYMDGANMNAQVGLTAPGVLGADVCHLNLHKTFCIPHGGGGPGVGPICVRRHLQPFLPGKAAGASVIANTRYGSASICLISYAYIRLMGSASLRRATQVAILHANYMAKKLASCFTIMYTNGNRCVAHELIIDCKPFKKLATVDDIAKRLMDYGFHAPTMSWPVPDTLMIEPTESEAKDEIDRFCAALQAIKAEIDALTPDTPLRANILKNAPHTLYDLGHEWTYTYSHSDAFFPTGTITPKWWPSCNRVDNAHGDRHLICACQIDTVSSTV